MNLLFALILLALALAGIVIRKTYYSLPVHELKRKAEHGDPVAAALYRAVAYGSSLRSLLWLIIGLLSAGSIILLARRLPVWVSLLIVGPVLWIAFSWLPASKTSGFGIALTRSVTPVFTWLLNYLHPLLSRGADAVEKRYTAVKHTGLFEREDLVSLIEQQQNQADNRLTVEELEIAKRALSFTDFEVGDILTPRKQVKTVLADDTVGPVLIDELHQSGGGIILVKDGAKGPIVGSLEFNQLNLHSQGHVHDLMNPTVYYVHEQDSLSEALHAFFVTNHPVFVVVNSFEEFVGIITVENILQQLLGHVPGDDFDQYSDLTAVAARYPRKAKKSKKSDETKVDENEDSKPED